MAFNPISGFAGSTSASTFSEDAGINSTASVLAPAPPLAQASGTPSWAPEISPDADGLPRLDTVLHRTIAGNNVTITQQELERLTLHSNAAWRLRAEATISRLEREVTELRSALLSQTTPAENDTNPIPQTETS